MNKENLIESINYQDGGIVSKELLKNENGNVTLFAFGEGQNLSEHSTPYEALLNVVDGEAEITIDGVLHQLTAGEFILLPAGHPHAVKAVTKFKMILTMIRKEAR